MLWIVGTPIGNLGDITERAREVLSRCTLVLCEDTRRTSILMDHLGLKKKLVSHHKFNENQRLDEVIAQLQNGEEIALVSDAGMPCLSDPGEELVRRCREENLPLSIVPGPNAALLALIGSGFPTHPFQFVGFLEKKEGALTKQLLDILHFSGTSVAYEAPHRIEKLISLLSRLAPTMRLSLARELTKLHEEVLIGTPQELLTHPSVKNPRGEWVVVFDRHPLAQEWEILSGKEHVALLENEYGITKQEALKLAATLRSVPKKSLYDEMIPRSNLL